MVLECKVVVVVGDVWLNGGKWGCFIYDRWFLVGL